MAATDSLPSPLPRDKSYHPKPPPGTRVSDPREPRHCPAEKVRNRGPAARLPTFGVLGGPGSEVRAGGDSPWATGRIGERRLVDTSVHYPAMQDPFDPALSNPQLRAELEAIIKPDDPKSVADQIAAVNELRNRYGHTIDVVETVADASRAPGQYNCYMFALGVQRSQAILELLADPYIKLGNGFMAWLLVNSHLSAVDPTTVTPNPVVLYMTSESPVHAGRWDRDRVVSKWGLDHVWRHRVYEVPSSYGAIAQPYGALPRDLVEQLFAQYVEQHG